MDIGTSNSQKKLRNTLHLVCQEFALLTVSALSHYQGKYIFWKCRCRCGNNMIVNQKDLFSGAVFSCGCTEKNPTAYNQNLSMSKPPSNNHSGVKGVWWSPETKLWQVRICHRKVNYTIASYENYLDAAIARQNAERIVAELEKEYQKIHPTLPPSPKEPSKDLTGLRFGKLTVQSLVHVKKYTLWHCLCDCGKEKDIYQHNLTSSSVTSCGCERSDLGKEAYRNNLHIYKGIQVEKAAAKRTPRNNTSGFRGVQKDSKTGKYRVRMIFQGIRYELGYYEDLDEAIKARLRGEEMRDVLVEEYRQLSGGP